MQIGCKNPVQYFPFLSAAAVQCSAAPRIHNGRPLPQETRSPYSGETAVSYRRCWPASRVAPAFSQVTRSMTRHNARIIISAGKCLVIWRVTCEHAGFTEPQSELTPNQAGEGRGLMAGQRGRIWEWGGGGMWKSPILQWIRSR
ncbi:hypothetical protein SKAU_G00320710 [Synaphobranchus kaupii]|uniref:Uncharacterized protein n=1 Tax=Synaphobranchus kaupii TaxID=118154 RepID=A0A9Q1ENM0_SYNKA|nr:hypothetical protein SKAU_G00320710 [Synaphobranchus kaupii]